MVRVYLQFTLLFLLLITVVGTFLTSAIPSAVQAATIVPWEYKYFVVNGFSSSPPRTTIINGLNTEGRNGWEVVTSIFECDNSNCSSARILLKRRK